MARTWFKDSMACIALFSLQFFYVGRDVIIMLAISGEMSPYVLIVYTLAFSTFSAALPAICLERRMIREMTTSIFLRILIMAILGPAIDQILYFVGLKFTYPSFTCAIVIPAMNFLVKMIAVICRRNTVDLKRWRFCAQVFGTLVTVIGAVTMTIYKGVLVISSAHTEASTNQRWFVGPLSFIVSAIVWSIRFVVQESTLEEYKAPWLTSSLENLLGLVFSSVFAFLVKGKNSFVFDINLLAAAYAGIFPSVMAYVENLAIEYKGQEFASAFIPLRIIIAAFMGPYFLPENIYLGGILGAVGIVPGLYLVIWGNYMESQEREELLPTVV